MRATRYDGNNKDKLAFIKSHTTNPLNPSDLDILNPYEFSDFDDEGVCLPLLLAAKHEKMCVYPKGEDRFVSKVQYIKGRTWEGDGVKLMMDLLNENPGFGYIDFGVNLGVFALSIASHHRFVLGVEPFPPTLKLLARTMRMNPQLLPWMTIVINAVSDRHETVKFYSQTTHPAATQTHSDDEIKRDGPPVNPKYVVFPHVQEARAIKTDDLIPAIPFRNAVMKMDIEDGEYKALRSASEMFKRINITHVMMEWAEKWKRPLEAQWIMHFFDERGYEARQKIKPHARLVNTFEASKKWPFNVLYIKKGIVKD